MKKLFIVTLPILLISLPITSQVSIGGLLTENLKDPVGIGVPNPRFSWQLKSESRSVLQSAYEIKITSGTAIQWSTGKVQSGESVQVPYAGMELQSGKKYNWQVRVWDNKGNVSQWSGPATFQMAFLQASDWKAKWIEPGYTENTAMRATPMMRKSFTLSKSVASATAYITAHGMYEAQINGKRVGDAFFTPGWTTYKKRLQYQVYDVTYLLKQGTNSIGVMLGSGWYRGNIGYLNNFNFYGSDIALLCQVDITYTDGTSESIITDESWKSSTGEILYSEIYNGEVVDARLEKTGWNDPGYNDSDWSGVKVTVQAMDNLIATQNEMVKKHETFVPVRIFKTPKGEQVIDFGQNLVGWVEMKVSGKAGDKVVLSHAEVLDQAGNFYTENLRAAKAQDTYILIGNKQEFFEPHFTWHGFRYLKIEGYPGEIIPENFTAVALYSDMEQTGNFSSSDMLINMLHHNIQWGQKGNFIDIPTDCPQRDERLGWTGDAQVFSRTAAFNMNVNNFFTKWLKDVEADQVDGKVPYVIPNVLGAEALNSAGWADVAMIVPWNMYLVYGDRQILSNQYSSMKAYVESIRKVSKDDLWISGFHFGDWLFYHPEDDVDGSSAVTDKYLIAQCFYAHSTQLLINAARVLGNKDDEANYGVLLQKIKDAFRKEYMTPVGRLVSGTQTAYVLALNFDMLPENLREQAAARLAENINRYNNHLTTGFLGTPYLCHVLTRFGYNDLAYKLLLQDTYPSWLYPVKQGATTIWERWDGLKPDSTFQTPSMNSFNHYAYGAIGDWMYHVMAGLDTYEDGAGYKHSRIKPVIGGGFTNAEASLDTYYGKLGCAWKVAGTKLSMDIEIPANTWATVYIPGSDSRVIFEGGEDISLVKDIQLVGNEGDYMVVRVGSGKYRFTR